MANINDGLVAYYPFNGNANDETPNSNHGIINGAVLMEDRLGNIDSAYLFDGTDDFIDLGTDNFSSADFSQGQSISVWFYNYNSETMTPGARLVDLEGRNGGIVFNYNRVTYLIHTNTQGTVPVVSIEQPSSAKWTHAVGTWDGTQMAIYIDGILQNIAPATGTLTSDNVSRNYTIGANYSQDSFGWFDGILDDVRVYNRALSESEIHELYNENQFIEVAIEINPGTLNLKSRGNYVTSYIELPEGVAATDIDVNSVIIDKINDKELSPPLYVVGTSEIGDYDENEILDLSVKFSRQELILLLNVGYAKLTISGMLIDGRHFESSIIIRVISKRKESTNTFLINTTLIYNLLLTKSGDAKKQGP